MYVDRLLLDRFSKSVPPKHFRAKLLFIHDDLDVIRLNQGRAVFTIEDARPAVACKRLFDGINAKRCIHRDLEQPDER